jgi:hypothetical protein
MSFQPQVSYLEARHFEKLKTPQNCCSGGPRQTYRAYLLTALVQIHCASRNAKAKQAAHQSGPTDTHQPPPMLNQRALKPSNPLAPCVPSCCSRSSVQSPKPREAHSQGFGVGQRLAAHGPHFLCVIPSFFFSDISLFLTTVSVAQRCRNGIFSSSSVLLLTPQLRVPCPCVFLFLFACFALLASGSLAPTWDDRRIKRPSFSNVRHPALFSEVSQQTPTWTWASL